MTLLEAEGQVEDAAILFREAADWEGITALIMEHASSLVAAGKSKTLEPWLVAMPENHVSGNPWLLYWLGKCRASDDSAAARNCFQKAFQLFRGRGMADGMFRTWSCIVDAVIREGKDYRPLDNWLAELDGVMREHPEFPSRKIEMRIAIGRFMCLMLRPPTPSALKEGREKVRGLLKEADSADRLTICLLLTCYNAWSGNYQVVARLIEELQQEIARSESAPLLTAKLKLIEAMHYCFSGEHDRCREAVAKGLAIAEQNGMPDVSYFLMVCRAENALLDGSGAEIAGVLAALHGKMANPREHVYYCLFSAWQALCEGKTNSAYDCLTDCETQVAELGSFHHESLWHIGMAQVRFARSEAPQAMAHLDTAFVTARKSKDLIGMYACLLFYARFFFAQGENAEGVVTLNAAMLVGREHGFMHIPWWQPELIADLCAKALENGIEVNYVKELIRRRGLTPQTPLMHVETWPWPLKIRTLGSFKITLHNAPVANGQRKPLELLKALICLGGKDVPAESLAATLWPEADGDYALRTLQSTLYRLRKLLGNDPLLQLRAGRLSLDPGHCWTDAQAFEHLCGEIEKANKGSEEKELLPLFEQAGGLYRGHFLPADRTLPYAAQMRRRLQDKFRHIIMMAGAYWERKGDWEKAIAWYQRGVETDELAEEFQKRLVFCYRRHGPPV